MDPIQADEVVIRGIASFRREVIGECIMDCRTRAAIAEAALATIPSAEVVTREIVRARITGIYSCVESLERLKESGGGSRSMEIAIQFIARPVAALSGAARGVLSRWDTPAWKEAEPAAEAMERLRKALSDVS